MMGNWGGWGPGFGWVFMILVWVLIIVGIAALAKWFISGGGRGGADKRPLDILQERYARGEITREQYGADAAGSQVLTCHGSSSEACRIVRHQVRPYAAGRRTRRDPSPGKVTVTPIKSRTSAPSAESTSSRC